MSTNIYKFTDIKTRLSCDEAMRRILNSEPVKDGRYNCPWRPDSDSGSFAVNDEGWYDHVTKEKGGVIDLVAKAMFNGDVQQSQSFLGAHLGLTPVKVKTSKKIVAEYNYTDREGNLVFQVVRYQPKDFRQRRPNMDNPGTWIHNLDGIVTPLYNWPAWKDASAVVVVEGEKDAESLISRQYPNVTTCAMGAEKWLEHHSEALKGKHVAILPDNDIAGEKHTRIVAESLLAGHAASVRIVRLGGLPPKGDVSDWLSQGHTVDELRQLIYETPETTVQSLNTEESAIDRAKRLNKSELCNYLINETEDDKGQPKLEKVPKNILSLVNEIHERFLGFPRRVGDSMFDHDRDNGEIRVFDKHATLFAWMQMKSGQAVKWNLKGEGFVTQDQLLEALLASAKRYDSISETPDWPPRQDVYYAHDPIPEPDKTHRFFHEFCAFFHPATVEDAIMLKAFICAPIYGRKGIPKPAWIIDSHGGQGSGKTTLVELVGRLYGGHGEAGEIIMIQPDMLKNGGDEIIKRLISVSGRRRKMFLIDNVTGNFNSPELADFVTRQSISGRAPYGRGEESRTNNLTYVITANSCSVGKDMADRSFFVYIDKPEHNPNWKTKALDFLAIHRLNVIADIVDILENTSRSDAPTRTRFPEFEQDVLMKFCEHDEEHISLMNKLEADRHESDIEVEWAEAVREKFCSELIALQIDPDEDSVFIHNQIASAWAKEAMADYKGAGHVQMIKNWAKIGKMSMVSAMAPRFQMRRGVAWTPNGKRYLWVVSLKDGKIIKSMVHHKQDTPF